MAGLESAIGALALGSFLWPLVIEPNAVEVGGLNGVLAAIFPLCDVLLLLLVLRLLFSRLHLPAAYLLAGASLCLVAADVAYFSPVFANGELAGRLVGVAYVVAYMLFGAAALHPSMRRMLVRAEHRGSRARAGCSCSSAAPRCRCPRRSRSAARSADKPIIEQLTIIGAAMTALVLIRIWQLLRHSDGLRRRAEASEQRFRMVFDSAGHGISIGAGGMMTETNAALQEMIGYKGSELSRMHYAETTHPDDKNLALKAQQRGDVGQAPGAHVPETARAQGRNGRLGRGDADARARRQLRHLARRRHHRAQDARSGASAGAEDGGRRQARRWHRARLQQHDDRRHRLHRHPPDRDRRRRSATAARRGHRGVRRRGRPS